MVRPRLGGSPAGEGAATARFQERVPQHALQLHTRSEQFVSTPELHSDEAIESDPLPLGQVWAVSPGSGETGPGPEVSLQIQLCYQPVK